MIVRAPIVSTLRSLCAGTEPPTDLDQCLRTLVAEKLCADPRTFNVRHSDSGAAEVRREE